MWYTGVDVCLLYLLRNILFSLPSSLQVFDCACDDLCLCVHRCQPGTAAASCSVLLRPDNWSKVSPSAGS